MTEFFTSKAGTEGFSLLEVIVATAILAVIVSGVMNVIFSSTNAASSQKDRLIATYLASEAIEFVRADRDSHWLESGLNEMEGWKTETSLDGEPHDENHIYDECLTTCWVDTRLGVNGGQGAWGPTGEDGRQLDYDKDNGLYGYGNGDPSRFSRAVEITERGTEVRVEATVTWEPIGPTDGGSVTIGESLFDYRQ